MTGQVTPELAARAWRRLCPDITDVEIDAMTRIGMRGDRCTVVLRAYRAGLAKACESTHGRDDRQEQGQESAA